MHLGQQKVRRLPGVLGDGLGEDGKNESCGEVYCKTADWLVELYMNL